MNGYIEDDNNFYINEDNFYIDEDFYIEDDELDGFVNQEKEKIKFLLKEKKSLNKLIKKIVFSHNKTLKSYKTNKYKDYFLETQNLLNDYKTRLNVLNNIFDELSSDYQFYLNERYKTNKEKMSLFIKKEKREKKKEIKPYTKQINFYERRIFNEKNLNELEKLRRFLVTCDEKMNYGVKVNNKKVWSKRGGEK